MTNLRSGRITDLLNNSMRYNPETIAIGYAVLQEKQRLMRLADRTRLMSQVETLDEQALDYLAADLRTPAYHDSYPLDVKRRLIAGTLPFYAKLGTPAAVDWALNAIFGGGGVEEWYDYGGDPHHFRAVIPVAGEITPENLTEFRRVLVAIKRLSSWLDSIITVTGMDGSIHAAPALGPLFSIAELPKREPPFASAALVVAPGLWGTWASLDLPANDPEFRGVRTANVAAALGGSYSSLTLPVLMRPATLSAAAMLGGSFYVTNLPEINGESEESII